MGKKPTISIASCSRSKSCFRSSPSTVKQSCWCQVETHKDRRREEDGERHQHHKGFLNEHINLTKACLITIKTSLLWRTKTWRFVKLIDVFSVHVSCRSWMTVYMCDYAGFPTIQHPRERPLKIKTISANIRGSYYTWKWNESIKHIIKSEVEEKQRKNKSQLSQK